MFLLVWSTNPKHQYLTTRGSMRLNSQLCFLQNLSTNLSFQRSTGDLHCWLPLKYDRDDWQCKWLWRKLLFFNFTISFLNEGSLVNVCTSCLAIAGAFNPNLEDPLPAQMKKQLVLKIISGQQLPKPKDSMLGDRGEVGHTRLNYWETYWNI